MAFDWTQDDSGEAVRIPVGQDVDVEITKVVFGSKSSGQFKSSSGDPRIMIVMADGEGREAAMFITLSEKAGWVLRALLSAAGVDRTKMQADGVKLSDFAREDFGSANLVGRRLKVRVKEYKDDSGNLANVVPLRARPQPMQDDDIPI